MVQGEWFKVHGYDTRPKMVGKIQRGLGNEGIVEKEATNVFVKDYYMWKFKTKKTGSIRKFMKDNYYDESKPYQFMKEVIENELKCQVLNVPLEIPKDLEKHKWELTEKIKKEIQQSFKYKWRDEDDRRG